MADGVNCGNCGAPVNGPPGVMRCPYCGDRVDIPLAAGAPQRILEQERAGERERARRHDSYEEDDESSSSSSESSSNPGAWIGGIVAVVIVAIVVGSIASSRKKKTSAKDERRPVTAAATTKTSKSTSSSSSSSDNESVVIPSCTCAFGDGQSTPLVTLSLKAPPLTDPLRPLWLGIKRQSGFVTETNSVTLDVNSPTVLSPADGGAMPTHMGVACDTGIYVLVADKVATGWSSVNARWKWTTTLPQAMVDGAPGDAGTPAPPKNTIFGSYCTPLATQNGSATIALAGGRRATLSLKDGKLR